MHMCYTGTDFLQVKFLQLLLVEHLVLVYCCTTTCWTASEGTVNCVKALIKTGGFTRAIMLSDYSAIK